MYIYIFRNSFAELKGCVVRDGVINLNIESIKPAIWNARFRFVAWLMKIAKGTGLI